MQALEIRPKLPHDTMFLPSDEGVVFRRAGRTLALKGKGIFQLISALAPHLNGEATVGQLTMQMPGAKTSVVAKLMATLVDDRMLINHSIEDEQRLSFKEREAFRSQIEFLEHLSVDPCQNFGRFRDAGLFLTGSGFPLAALATSLIRNGARNVAIDCEAHMGEWAASVSEAAAEMREKGLDCNLHSRPLPDTLGPESEISIDAACYASDKANINRLLQINRWCRARRTVLIPGILLGGAYHVGPIVSQPNEACWECALLRYTDQCPAAEARDMWQQAALDTIGTSCPWPESSPAVRIFANSLGFHVFRNFTGMAADRDSIVSLDTMTLESKTTKIFTHPKCRACAERNRSTEPVATSARQFSREPLEAWNEKLQAITPLVDGRFGIFNTFEDDHIVQSPLFRSTLLTSQRQSSIERPRTSATSVENNAAARIEGLLEAAGPYALAMRSADRILSTSAIDQQGIERIDGEHLTVHMGGSRPVVHHCDAEWVTGKSLRTGVRRAVPAAAVFPAARNEAIYFEPSPAGIGCGFSEEEASIKAIHSSLAFETLKSIAKGELFPHRFRIRESGGDNYALNCLKMLEADPEIWGIDSGGFALALASRRAGEFAGPIAVGYGNTLSHSVAMAAKELLAIELGDGSRTSLDVLLPLELGYHFPALQAGDESSCIAVVEQDRTATPADLAKSLEDRRQDAILCDITPRDLAGAGLFVIKAVLANDTGAESM